jgi:hypothetical protein
LEFPAVKVGENGTKAVKAVKI